MHLNKRELEKRSPILLLTTPMKLTSTLNDCQEGANQPRQMFKRADFPLKGPFLVD